MGHPVYISVCVCVCVCVCVKINVYRISMWPLWHGQVLVIGCGPCGLRAAIEAQLLGARVVLLEKRDRFSRNNVLHLWPMVIHDLKALGAKKFFGKFCAGAIDHISEYLGRCRGEREKGVATSRISRGHGTRGCLF